VLQYRPYILSNFADETKEVRSFVFAPADGKDVPFFKAGQFFMLRINDVPGLRPPMRSYSAARPYAPDRLCFGIKLHGPFTHALFEKKKGDKIEICGPYGFFTLVPNSQPIVLLAAGIGITPLLCMAEDLAQKNDPRPVKLFYSNRSLSSAPYLSLLRQLEEKNPNFKLIPTLSGEDVPQDWNGEKGRISIEMLRKHNVDFARSHFYFCGPKEFNEAMQKMLESEKVEKERIHKESW
jgi:ferredoxin-NADP reductase